MKKFFILTVTASMAAFLASSCTCVEKGTCKMAPPDYEKPRVFQQLTCEAASDGCISNGARMANDDFKSPEGRQMAFTAQMRLNVSDVKEAVSQTRAIALKAGGYVRRLDDASIVIAIPVDKADEVMKSLGKTGAVASLRIEGEDVTERVSDVKIRLENMKRSRARLLSLLEKTDKVEEILKIEKELTRITTDIERLEASQKGLKSRVDFVTVTVIFSRIAIGTTANCRVPVQWINELGNDLLNGNEILRPCDERPLFDVSLPDGFVFNGKYMAISFDNCRIRFSEHPNAVTENHWYGNEYADLSFYEPMMEKVLKEKFNCDVEKVSCKIDGMDGMTFTVKPVFGEKTYVLRVAAVADGNVIKVISVSSAEDSFRKNFPDKSWDEFISSVKL